MRLYSIDAFDAKLSPTAGVILQLTGLGDQLVIEYIEDACTQEELDAILWDQLSITTTALSLQGKTCPIEYSVPLECGDTLRGTLDVSISHIAGVAVA